MSELERAHDLTDDEPITWPEKLRDAADWFDLVDRLLAMIRVEVKSTSTKTLLSDIAGSSEIQDDLRRLADEMDRQTNTENGRVVSYVVLEEGGY